MKLSDVRIERVPFGHERFALAKSIEFRIFGEVNGYLSDRDRWAGEVLAYLPYETSSEFHIAWRPDGDRERPIGIIRLIRYDPVKGIESCITLRDYRRWPGRLGIPENHLFPDWDEFFQGLDPATVAELATQAVLPPYRGQGLLELLWLSIGAVSFGAGVRRWTMALVVPLFHHYKRMFPNAIHAIGRMISDYIGAESIPATIDIRHPEVDELRRLLLVWPELPPSLRQQWEELESRGMLGIPA